MLKSSYIYLLLGLFTTMSSFASARESLPPNVIVIFADDLGYADLGIQGSPDVKTPHIDSLAEHGIRFTNAYVTSPQCAPSRAGLLTGRYQNRFGFESNEQGYSPGIPLEQKVISERMKEAGYVTGMFGKWGVTNRRWGHPPQRGFDESLWNHDGNLYFPAKSSPHDTQMRRGNDAIEVTEYSTDAFASAAVEFIQEHHDQPFFIYLPLITPHEPMEAKPEDLARFPETKDPLRQTFLAMMANLDNNVGRILETLRDLNLEEQTMIILLSDNGGYAGNASLNKPFSGTKSQMLEGGIRVPFIVQWKGRLPEGEVYHEPVISLDILPTALAAANVEIDPKWKLDGVNLLPYLTSQVSGSPHEALFWRFNFPMDEPEQHGWAVRKGDWKLVRNGWARTPVALYNLSADPAEQNDLSQREPAKLQELTALWEQWNQKNIEPARP